MTKKELDKKITEIAKDNFIGVTTLDRRYSDSMDFHDVAVWSIKAALEEAYELGLAEGRKEGKN